ncbi:helix-turn-helix domain-containing protein [Pontibacter toksunensis]|uniref:Helix-turn-helix domain-containing protein n=1 Tax=Pontibacter toksunensis TaxID=1332631 RepID=A0ABW6BW27_9BACT
MILQTSPAPLELAPFVSGYLFGQSEFKDSRLIPTLPRGVPALMVVMNEDNKGQLECIQLNQVQSITNGVYLCGQATQMWWLRVRTCQSYMVVLKPTALQKVLGESADVFNDTYLRLDDLIPDCQFLPEQLLDEKNQKGQLSVLEIFLRRLFRDKFIKPNEVDMAVQYILQTQGQVKIGELSVRERANARTLTRKFTEQVGLTPKLYARIIRFRAIMNYLLLNPEASLLDVTYKFGFYDQSHFIKDFYDFTGHSPNQYLSTDQSFDGHFIKAVCSIS